jgi:hypothetical protein
MAITTTAIAVASLAATAVGTGVQMYGQYQAGKTAEKIANRNAQVREEAARNSENETIENVRRMRRESRRNLARMRGRFAKAGVTAEGTPLEVLADQAAEFELQAADEYRQGTIYANRLRTQADMDRMEGASARRQSMYAMGSTLFSGIASMGGQYGNFKHLGAFKG